MTSLPGSVIPSAHGIPNADKVVHFSLYLVFGYLLMRARAGAISWLLVGRIVVAIAIFAALDEWHQQFIPGRDMDRLDWLADMTGAAVGILIFLQAKRRREQTT
ncbi:MAG: VanZ family protein [Gemmatimonadaceae bacterium]